MGSSCVKQQSRDDVCAALKSVRFSNEEELELLYDQNRNQNKNEDYLQEHIDDLKNIGICPCRISALKFHHNHKIQELCTNYVWNECCQQIYQNSKNEKYVPTTHLGETLKKLEKCPCLLQYVEFGYDENVIKIIWKSEHTH